MVGEPSWDVFVPLGRPGEGHPGNDDGRVEGCGRGGFGLAAASVNRERSKIFWFRFGHEFHSRRSRQGHGIRRGRSEFHWRVLRLQVHCFALEFIFQLLRVEYPIRFNHAIISIIIIIIIIIIKNVPFRNRR